MIVLTLKDALYKIIPNLQLSVFENTQYTNIDVFFMFFFLWLGIEKKIDNINKDIQKLHSLIEKKCP